MRRGPAVVIAAVVLVAAGAIGVWWMTREVERTLEAGWRAAVLTIAGDGVAGVRDGWRTRARFSDPFGIAVAPDGSIYVADGGDTRAIRRIGPDGFVTSLGTGALDTPSGVAIDAGGQIYVSDTAANVIFRFAPDGRPSVIAAAAHGLNGPMGLAIDGAGRVVVADTYNDRIVTIASDGTMRPLAGGGGPGFVDGSAAEARFDTPTGVAIDRAGNVWVADLGNGALRLITTAGEVQTIAPGPADPLIRPIGVASGPDGALFVADDRGRILEVLAAGGLRLVAGGRSGYLDGPGDQALFRGPSGIAVVAAGRLVVTDRRNAVVRSIEAVSMTDLRPPAPPMAPHFDLSAFARAPLLWPFVPFEGPHEITGTLGEPRGGVGSERLHAGLDVYAPEGELVHAIRDGFVDHPASAFDFGSINESLRIGPITYIHMRAARNHRDAPMSDPRFVFTLDERGRAQRVRVKRGARFRAGEAIGTVNRFYHAHINIGWPGEEHNPLLVTLPNHIDTVPPTIPRNGVRVVGEDGVPLKARAANRLLVSGRVRIVVDAWDQVDGNESRRRLGLYRLGYGILPAAGSALPGLPVQETMRFDRQPSDPEAPRLIYADGSGIPVYGSRTSRFLYRVTTTYRDGVAADALLDTSSIAPGDYTLRILAADLSGNEAIANRDLPIRIVPSGDLGER